MTARPDEVVAWRYYRPGVGYRVTMDKTEVATAELNKCKVDDLVLAEALGNGITLAELTLAQERGDAWRDKFDDDTTELARLKMVVKLLVTGGFVTQDKVDEATNIATEVWPDRIRRAAAGEGDGND